MSTYSSGGLVEGWEIVADFAFPVGQWSRVRSKPGAVRKPISNQFQYKANLYNNALIIFR